MSASTNKREDDVVDEDGTGKNVYCQNRSTANDIVSRRCCDGDIYNLRFTARMERQRKGRI